MQTPATTAHLAPLTRAQGDDVLRYWLAAVRLEETLKVRPRARRTRHESDVPRIDLPAPGQEYFKLSLADELSAVLTREEPTRRAFDGELAAFFESWLLTNYRRSQDESELSHLLCFPVVHLPRGELAGLLRCGVRLRFATDGGKPFRVPSRADRKRGAFPPPPNEARIARAPRSEGVWPFFIDTRLLGHPLGLSSEDIDALFEELRQQETMSEAQMLAIVVGALEKAVVQLAPERPRASDPSRTDDVPSLLARLRHAMSTLLKAGRTRAEVYPVGIVIDGSQSKTTWHLQRELLGLIESDPDTWQQESCLGAYLTHRALPDGESPQRALFDGPSLTASQRAAAERFWGSRLTAVQGPPGTGKTTLILHLCAEALVRQVDGLLDKQTMSADLMVIVSGNNRAVDNVIDPLSEAAGLPLALRVGSRQVCEHGLSQRLRQTQAWLHHAQVEPAAVRAQALETALSDFARERAHLDAQLAPRREALARHAERKRLHDVRDALLGAAPTRAKGRKKRANTLSLTNAQGLDKALGKLERRLRALSELCGGKPGMAQVNAIARHYELTARRDLPPLESALTEAGLSLDVPLPPLETPLDVVALMEAWEEGAETFLERLTGLREAVDGALGDDRLTRAAREVEAQLAALGPEDDAPPPSSGDHDELSRALFSAAVRAREAWASAQAESLHETVSVALQVVEQERSLRPLFRNEPEHATRLCRLFGVWGSTLLSLGNCLPAEADRVARVVIDEAGQCHPAHAVSALMRATSAMIIGDVHQLSPVIDLSVDDEARLVRSLRLKLDASALDPYRVSSESQVSAQSLADLAVHQRLSLVDHFRCHPQIIAISDALCGYGLQVFAAPASQTAGSAWLGDPVLLRDLVGEQERHQGSLCNELELRETLRLVDTLLARGSQPSELAIITPYRGQLERLRRGLLERGVPLELSPELLDGDGPTPRLHHGVALGTVHRFQGGERSIVLFSSVVTRVGALGFLNARPNLLNVAISRARHHFVCLGHREVLLQGARTRLLVEAARPLPGS